jgi:hypothetical protein
MCLLLGSPARSPVNSPASSPSTSPMISIFCYISIFLLRGFRRVSGEIPASLDFFFYFMGRTVFCYNVAKASYFFAAGRCFLLHSVKPDLTVQDDRSDGWRPGGWEIRSPGGRPALSFPKYSSGADAAQT